MKIPIKEYQEIEFNDENIKFHKNQMKDIKESLEKLMSDYSAFKKQISDYYQKFEICFPDLLKEVNSCIDWLQYNKNMNAKKVENINNNECFINNICEKYEKCYNCINSINENDYINKINEMNKKLQKTIKDIFELKFYPPKCGNFENNILTIVS